nr:MAG TPA: hypothetical protein [Caudoviricetes sp.]
MIIIGEESVTASFSFCLSFSWGSFTFVVLSPY